MLTRGGDNGGLTREGSHVRTRTETGGATKRYTIGPNEEYAWVYDQDNNRFRLESSDVDGDGTTGDVIRVADGTRQTQFGGDVRVGGFGSPAAALDVRGGAVVNEDGDAVDLRVESEDSEHMLHVHGASAPSGAQVSIGTDVNNDWGSLFVGNRDASGASEVDIVATLGETGGSAAPTIDGNNTEVWGVALRSVTLTADTSTTVTDAAPLYVDGPLVAGSNVSITNQWLALIEDSADSEVWGALDSGEVRISQGPLKLQANQSKFFFGAGDQYSLQFDDTTGANGALVFTDEDNSDLELKFLVGGGIEFSGQTIDSALDAGEDIFKLRSIDNDDELRYVLNSSNQFEVKTLDTSTDPDTKTTHWLYDPTEGFVRNKTDIRFDALTGTPKFSDHDHSEGGLSTIPNAGLDNDSITVSTNNPLTGGGSPTLGGSGITLDLNIDRGLTTDGSGNLEADIGNALTFNTGTIAVATDGIQSDELDQSVTYTFTTNQKVQRSEPGSGLVTFLALVDATSSDELRWRLTSGGLYELRVFDSSASTERDLLQIDPAQDRITLPATLEISQDLTDGSQTIWDSANATVPTGALGSILDSNDDVEDAHLGNACQTPESGDVSYPTASFVTDREPNANRPVEVTVHYRIQSSDTTQAEINVRIDDDGDGTNDQAIPLTVDATGLATNPAIDARETVTFTLSAGGQYSLTNDADPNGSNNIILIREVRL